MTSKNLYTLDDAATVYNKEYKILLKDLKKS